MTLIDFFMTLIDFYRVFPGVVGMVDSPITNLNKFYNTLTAWANSKPEETMNCRVQIWQALDM